MAQAVTGYPADAYFNREEPMPRQHHDWSCAACSLAWLNRAMGIDRGTSEDAAIALIGQPTNINSTYGLCEGSGRRLAELLWEDRGAAWHAWTDFWSIHTASRDHAILLGGTRWYHWVGVRSADEGVLSIANSAPGWKGVDQELTELEFRALGPFAAVFVPIHVEFPSIDD